MPKRRRRLTGRDDERGRDRSQVPFEYRYVVLDPARKGGAGVLAVEQVPKARPPRRGSTCALTHCVRVCVHTHTQALNHKRGSRC